MKSYRTKYGEFSADGTEYVITHPPHAAAVDQRHQQRRLRSDGLADGQRIQLADACAAEPADALGTGPHQGRLGEVPLHPRRAGQRLVRGVETRVREPSAYECRHGVGYTVITNTDQRDRDASSSCSSRTMTRWKCGAHPHQHGRESRADSDSSAIWSGGSARLPTGTGNSTNRSSRRRSIQPPRLCLRRNVSGKCPPTGDTGTPTGRMCLPRCEPEAVRVRCGQGVVPRDVRQPGALPQSVAKGTLARRTGNWLDPIGSLQVTSPSSRARQRRSSLRLARRTSADEARIPDRQVPDRGRRFRRPWRRCAQRWAGAARHRASQHP